VRRPCRDRARLRARPVAAQRQQLLDPPGERQAEAQQRLERDEQLASNWSGALRAPKARITSSPT
jgi:hypothetical protein